MRYALTVMIRPQRSCLGPWIISQEVPGNDTSEHNPFKKYFNPLHNTKTSSFSTSTTKNNITSKKNRNKISITTNMKVTKTQIINLRQWNRVPDVDWTLWLQSWHQESLLQRFKQGSDSVRKLVDCTSWSDLHVSICKLTRKANLSAKDGNAKTEGRHKNHNTWQCCQSCLHTGDHLHKKAVCEHQSSD